MNSITYTIPNTLVKEKEILEAKCNLLIEAFNQLCKEESERLAEEKKQKLANVKWKYSIKSIENGWRILYKEMSEETKIEDSNVSSEGWSRPFKIVNGVLFHSADAYRQKCYTKANELIPQGIFDESTLEAININW